MADTDPAAAILKRAPAFARVRADAWDAFNEAKDEDDLAARLERLDLPKNVKAELWDLKAQARPARSAAPAPAPDAAPSADEQAMESLREMAMGQEGLAPKDLEAGPVERTVGPATAGLIALGPIGALGRVPQIATTSPKTAAAVAGIKGLVTGKGARDSAIDAGMAWAGGKYLPEVAGKVLSTVAPAVLKSPITKVAAARLGFDLRKILQAFGGAEANAAAAAAPKIAGTMEASIPGGPSPLVRPVAPVAAPRIEASVPGGPTSAGAATGARVAERAEAEMLIKRIVNMRTKAKLSPGQTIATLEQNYGLSAKDAREWYRLVAEKHGF